MFAYSCRHSGFVNGFIIHHAPDRKRVLQLAPAFRPKRHFSVVEQALVQLCPDAWLVHSDTDKHQFLAAVTPFAVQFFSDAGAVFGVVRPFGFLHRASP